MHVALVGCGLIGNKRAKSLVGLGHTLIAAADAIPARATQLATAYANCSAHANWREMVARSDVDAVVVATTNDSLSSVILAAVQEGKHVLVEKPAARSAEELRPVLEAAKKTGVVVRVGFNHRFHPALRNAKRLVDTRRLDRSCSCGAAMGTAAGPVTTANGEPTRHSRAVVNCSIKGSISSTSRGWFLGDIAAVSGHIGTFFWKMPVEDNGFVFLRTAGGQVGWLHASCSEWKNLFCLEIYGRTGKLQIDGLGGSYGIERLSFYRMLPQMGPPETTIWEYPGEDLSWSLEFSDFASAIAGQSGQGATLEDAYAALRVVSEVYAQNRAVNRAAA